MMAKPVFRKAEISDLDTVCRIYWDILAVKEYAEKIHWKKDVYPAVCDFERYILAGEMYLLFADGSPAAAVAVTEKQAAEYASAKWHVPAAENEVAVVHLLAVRPEFMHTGLSPLLMDHVVELASSAGKKALRLDTVLANVPAQRFYEKYGFRNCGTLKMTNPSVQNETFVLYELPLPVAPRNAALSGGHHDE